MNISPETLVRALGCTPARASAFAPLISEACATYEINTPQRLAFFLAQIGHESGALKWLREIWGPTPAQARYEGRVDLGNVEAGDGKRYMGRGLIQTTGRANYAKLRDRLRVRLPSVPDFEATPEALEEPKWAVLSATDYWDMRGLNALADAGDFKAATKRINGGLNGLADRQARLERAQRALAGEAPAPQAQAKENEVAPFVAAALPAILSAAPDLISLFKGDSPTDERNAKVANVVVEVAKRAVGATNEQELVETLEQKPEAEAVVRKAVQDSWFEIAEAGGGGIAGARQADLAFAEGKARFWHSPSFWALLMLAPLAYMIVGSVSGLWGYNEWSDDVRAAISTAVISLIIGGAAGYYWGSTTSRNRPA